MIIISGGQTGVDEAALIAARRCDILSCGWCPLGRKNEIGIIHKRYPLTESKSSNYIERTKLNIRDSIGTLIIGKNKPIGGTKLTLEFVKEINKPYLYIDMNTIINSKIKYEFEVEYISNWIKENNIFVLNIAGPRESKYPGISDITVVFLCRIFEKLLWDC